MNTDEKIVAYGRNSLNLDCLTVEELIESHKYLRSLNLELNEERKKVIKQAYSNAFEIAKKHVLEYDFISREKLKKMTLLELARINSL